MKKSLFLLFVFCVLFVVFRTPGESASSPTIVVQESTPRLREVWTSGGVQVLTVQGDFIFGGAGRHLIIVRSVDPNYLEPVGYSAALPEAIVDLDVNGDYVYAVGESGLYIVDVSNPAHPVLTATYQVDGYRFYSATIVGKLGYVATDHGIRILNLANPLEVTEVGSYWQSAIEIAVVNQTAFLLTGASVDIVDISNPADPQLLGVFYGQQLHSLSASEGYLYLLSVADGLLIVDVSDPASPVEVGQLPASGWDLAVFEEYVYLDGSWDIITVDVSDPTNPIELDSHLPEGAAPLGVVRDLVVSEDGELYASNAGRIVRFQKGEAHMFHELSGYGPMETRKVAIYGRYAYVMGDIYLHVLDLQNSWYPTEVGYFPVGFSAVDLAAKGSYLYLTDVYNGIRVLDISDSRAPQEIASYKVDGASNIEAVGNYLYVDTDEGVIVLDIRLPSNPQLVETLPFGGQLVRVGNYLLVNGSEFRIVNVANPSNPSLVSSYDSGSPFSEMTANENRAYLVTNDQEVVILDISDPAHVQKIGSFDRSLIGGDFIGRISVRGNYLALGSMNELYLVDVSQPSTPTIIDHVVMEGGNYLDGWVRDVVSTTGGFYVTANRVGARYYRLEQSVEKTIATGDETVTLGPIVANFAANSFQEETTISYVPLELSDVPASGAMAVPPRFELRASNSYGDSVQPAHPFTLTVQYQESGVSESSLQLMRWESGGWRSVPGTVDAQKNTITVTADSMGMWMVAGSHNNNMFLPQIGDSYAPTDLYIERLEITQAIQRPDNSVPLVSGKPAVLRVYAQTNSWLPVNNVSLRITATRNGQTLPDSPLVVGPWTIYSQSSPPLWGRQFNISLPSSWLSGNVKITATLDPAGAIAEGDESNNSETITAQFTEAPPLQVTLVPVHWTDTWTGNVCTAPAEDYVSDYLLQTFPVGTVHIAFREPVSYVGDLLGNSGALLEKLAATKTLDGSPRSTIYYGLVSVESAQGAYCEMGGLLGQAFTRGRVGFGIYGSSGTAAHEIGHSLGLLHAPCGVSASVDPDFPYPDGSTGHTVYLPASHRTFSPGPPDYNKDLMSYCAGTGFSDYHYIELYEDQLANGAPPASHAVTDAFYIRVSLDDGNPILHPTYRMPASISTLPETSEYVLELRGERGQLIASHPLPILEAEERGVSSRAIHATIPVPEQEVASLSLLHQGSPVVSRSIATAPPGLQAAELAVVGDNAVLHWTEGVPVTIRFTSDEGQTWTTLAFDVTEGKFSLENVTSNLGDGQLEIRRADAVDSLLGLFPYQSPE